MAVETVGTVNTHISINPNHTIIVNKPKELACQGGGERPGLLPGYSKSGTFEEYLPVE